MKSKTLQTILLSVIGLVFTVNAQAVEVIRTKAYIYWKTPLNEMVSDEREVLVKRSIEMTVEAIDMALVAAGLKKNEFNEQYARVEIANRKVDEMATILSQYMSQDEYMGLRLMSLLPSAVMVSVGGSFQINAGGGVGASVGLGVILVPTKVRRLDLLTREVDEYFTLDYSIILIGTGDIGGGAGGGVKVRAGLGLIWGPLAKPEDFKGLALAGSADVTAGPVGLNIKAGVLKQWGKVLFMNKKVNPFVWAQYQGGVAAEAAAHGNIIPIFDISGPLQKMMETSMNGMFGDSVEIQDKRIILNPKPIDGGGGGGNPPIQIGIPSDPASDRTRH